MLTKSANFVNLLEGPMRLPSEVKLSLKKYHLRKPVMLKYLHFELVLALLLRSQKSQG